MSFNEIKSYINELHKIGITKIILIGGEPTIHEDIIKIVKYITSKGIMFPWHQMEKNFQT